MGILDGMIRSVTKTRPSELLATRREEVLELIRRHGGSNVVVFGSVARGEDTEDSDIDLLCDLPPGTSLFDLAGIQIDLEDLLGVKVDLGTPRSLRGRIRNQVLAEAKPL